MMSTTTPLLLPCHLSIPNSASLTVTNGRQLTNHPTYSLIDRCTNIDQLKQIHAHMIRTSLFFHQYSATKLFSASSLSSFSSLDYAHKVFDQIPEPNLYSWNTLIRAYASSSQPVQSISLFLRMIDETPHSPNKFTFPFLIKAAAQGLRLHLGQALHAMVIKNSFGSDIFVLNSLINCYSSCGDLDSAYKLFVMILHKDVVSWNSMITGFAHMGFPEKALELFRMMKIENMKPNGITMISLLSACANKSDLELGRSICSYIEDHEIKNTLILSNAMLDMYVKCGSIRDAESLFGRMEEKDSVTWTTMLDGYAKLGEYDTAKRIFDTMPSQDIAAWNVLISAYEQNGKPKEALAVFRDLQLTRSAKPDQVTFVSTLSACAQLGAIHLGGWIHVYIKKQGMPLNCHIATSLIDMYSKCGTLHKALEVFNSVDRRDVFVWSSMIAGLAMHGRGKDAVDLFLRMNDAKVKPNHVTFTNVLCACSHSGLVEQGRKFFDQMESVYGVVREAKHYACMVDILGRAGHLEEAMKLIETMPITRNASVWGALLGACRIHNNLELAELACTQLLELEPDNDGAYVLLSNIYAKRGNWDCVSRLRKHMRFSGLKKEPGCSSIEVNGVIHEFLVGDNTHPLCKEIYTKLDEIVGRLKSSGYVPNKSQILQLVEEEDMKEQALNHHSEKLAIAFGLISMEASQPIRVVKNLRVCEDCHLVAKLVSQLYNREIVLRDRYRFHHFSGGHCSCMDFW